jgi:AcrR family transcriptional regulator
MVEIAGEEGYAAATIARVVVRAGVSRPCFYEHFAAKQECFLAALREVQAGVRIDVARAVHAPAPERVVEARIAALVALADSQPVTACFLMQETLAGGARTLEGRERGITELAAIVEDAYGQLDRKVAIAELYVPALLGAIQRLLGSRLRRRERLPAGMLDELLRWTASYRGSAGEQYWRELTPLSPPACSPFLPNVALHAPPPLPPGRPRMSERQVTENHRQRILFATAEVIGRVGYGEATVAEIAKGAGVDGRVFYRQFRDKQEAFMALHELAFRSTMAVTVGAFFSGVECPERVWEAGRAFTQFLEQNLILVRASLVEGHAGGAVAVQRFESLLGAFVIFLHEGYQQAPTRHTPTRLALEAISAMSLEIIQRQARRGGAHPEIPGLLAPLAYVCMAPFLGPRATMEAITAQIAADGAGGGR